MINTKNIGILVTLRIFSQANALVGHPAVPLTRILSRVYSSYITMINDADAFFPTYCGAVQTGEMSMCISVSTCWKDHHLCYYRVVRQVVGGDRGRGASQLQ